MKERASERGSEFTFGVSWMRIKLKKLVSECKGAAMTKNCYRYQQVSGGAGIWEIVPSSLCA